MVFSNVIKELWIEKRRAQKAETRYHKDDDFKIQVRDTAASFEKAARESMEKLHDEFAHDVCDDKSLLMFWKLHASMKRAKNHNNLAS